MDDLIKYSSNSIKIKILQKLVDNYIQNFTNQNPGDLIDFENNLSELLRNLYSVKEICINILTKP